MVGMVGNRDGRDYVPSSLGLVRRQRGSMASRRLDRNRRVRFHFSGLAY